DGQRRRCGGRRDHSRDRRNLRPRLCADVQRGVHVRDPRTGARVPAAWNSGTAGMSAAAWRNAMNAGAGRLAMEKVAIAPRQETTPRTFQTPVRLRHAAVLAALLVFPWVASPFVTFQIGAQSLALGLIALSLTFLGGYGGMISLAQMTVAGIAGYMVGIFGTSGAAEISLGWPWWIVVTLALAIATLAGTFIGWLSVRTEGIYTIMITLAVGVAFYYLCLQNYSVFN